MEIKFDEKTNSYTLVENAEVPKGEVAKMEQLGALSGVARFEVFGLPLGAVAIATASAVVIDRLIGERLAGWGPVANLGVAWAVKQFGTRFIGAEAANATAFVLVYEAVADTVQSWIEGVWPTGAAQQRQQKPGGNGGTPQKQRVASMLGRYAEAF